MKAPRSSSEFAALATRVERLELEIGDVLSHCKGIPGVFVAPGDLSVRTLPGLRKQLDGLAGQALRREQGHAA